MHAEGLNAQAGSDNDVRQWQLTPEPVDLDRVILNHQLAGKKFGRLLVLACIGSTGGPAPLLCFCECGHFTVTTAANLKAGVRSCGCLKAEKARETGSRITHGGKGTRLYHIWCDMKHRCAARSGRLFDYYGARGIHVCREWNDSFEAFRAWSLANGYAEGLSIDRIDNSGPYSPHNCRWSTQAQQNRNYSRNIVVEYEGKHMLLTDAAELSGIPYGALRYRYHHGGKDNPTRLFAPLQVAEKANNGDTGRTPVLK